MKINCKNYLTIRQRSRVVYERIVYSLRDNEAELSNCFKAVFHQAKFFDRIEISLCFMSSRAELIVKRQREISFRSKNSASWNQAFTSTQMELIRNLLNLNNINFGSNEKFPLVENRLQYKPHKENGTFHLIFMSNDNFLTIRNERLNGFL